MKTIFRAIIFSLCCMSAIFASAMDLPVKMVNGKAYYYYVVKKGDTIYSLQKRLGITHKQLVESNPGAADGLRTDATLLFAVNEFGDGSPVVIETEESAEPQPTDIVMHKVKKGETLYGISRQYGVKPDDIIALNPEAVSGIKKDATLRIPVTKPEDAAPVAADEVKQEDVLNEDVFMSPEYRLKPVRPAIETVPMDGEDESENDASQYEEGDTTEVQTESRPATIAVILPFMLEEETPGKQAMLFTDFYKGLLLAADTLSNRGDSVKIYAYDTMCDMARLKAILSEDAVRDASVIIAPDGDAQLAAIADAVAGRDTKVINVFNVKDSLFVNHPELIQTNIPHRKMYAKAVDAMMRIYPDYVPVIIRNRDGRNDKAEFINYMTDVYRSRGVEPIEVEYEGALVVAQLDALPTDGTRYVIVPTSGSLNEFNKFIHAIKTERDIRDIALFGYPDWTAFRGDAEELLHAVDATVFSRFYYDDDSFDTRSLARAFERWYGSPMIEVVPNQGVLGFDVGNMVIRNLRANNGSFNPEDERYTGVQSSFEFNRAADNDSAGYCNNEIYILRFAPGRRVERLSF
ncbi:MAG: LysM peptidoglycan-binding domain-containing protein [Muribaculaceae bacterium]|nr:LysM peptidoglycan-binding domain-containing protein [Muribaculaceae bacterium]